MARRASCPVCGNELEGAPRFVLVRGRTREPHCSEACLHERVRARRAAEAAVRRRWVTRLVVIALAAGGAHTAWRRFHAPPPQSISLAWLEEPPRAPRPPPPPMFGPAWPPTDDDWSFAFARAAWVYPLPGPARRPTTADARVFGPEPPRERPALCRSDGRCGVDLGGQLWGEHVYAACDGVVDRVHGVGGDEHGGHYVRLACFGGMAFTQYFHLAATPRGLVRGAHVHAGDVIGLVGDSGLDGAPRHLTFALSVRPSSDFSEIYWDPAPLMAAWPLHAPPRGTVAGYVAPNRR